MSDANDAMIAAVLRSQREGLRAALLLLEHLPDTHRAPVKAGCVQALGAIEDALGEPRTVPTRDQRRQGRVLHGVVE